MKKLLILILLTAGVQASGQDTINLFAAQKPTGIFKMFKSTKHGLNRNEAGRATSKRHKFRFDKQTADLNQVELFTPDFKVKTTLTDRATYKRGRHYFAGYGRSGVVSISDDGQQVTGRLDSLVITESGMSGDSILRKDFHTAQDLPPTPTGQSLKQLDFSLQSDPGPVSCKQVRIYYEISNSYYLASGGTIQKTMDNFTALFAQVANIYFNTGIILKIQTVKIWDTPDPYISLIGSGQILNAFATDNYQKPEAKNYDLGFFIDLASGTHAGNGGLAYLNGINNPSGKYGYASIYKTSTTVSNSNWSVKCVSHENGHLLGCRHTHSCWWPGGPIDSCFTAEQYGTPICRPASARAAKKGGCIMSYCDKMYPGYVDPSLGFWNQTASVIRAGLAASSVPCVGTPPPTPCTYTYSTWSSCQPNGTQTRTVVSQTPIGCTGTPVLSQACTYVPPVVIEDGVIGPVMHYTQNSTSFFKFNIPATGTWQYEVSYCRYDGTMNPPDSVTPPAACGIRNALNFSRPTAIQLSAGQINLLAIQQPTVKNKWYRIKVRYRNGASGAILVKQSAWFWW